MSCHYKPFCEHYRLKKLLHKNKSLIGGTDPSKNKEKKSALLIIDVQNDFLPGGSIAVMRGALNNGEDMCDRMINSINELIGSDIFDMYIFTKDAHPPGHVSFASSHVDANPFDVVELKNDNQDPYNQVLWPDHCTTDGNRGGINFSNKLILPFDTDKHPDSTYIKNPIISCSSSANIHRGNLAAKSHILWKGLDKDTDSYSAFKDAQMRETGLRKFLMSNNITDVYLCGLARDFGVWWSAIDATTYINAETNEREFNVHFIWDATLPIPGSSSLPDYDPSGLSPHQRAINRIGVDVVHKDLEKNNIDGNNWIRAFLEPYGVQAIGWGSLVRTMGSNEHKDKTGQHGGSIFVKQKKVVKKDQIIEVGTETKDFMYHIFKQK